MFSDLTLLAVLIQAPIWTRPRPLAARWRAWIWKVENHAYAVALHMMYYNFVKIRTKLRTSPAMAASVSDRLWEVSDIVALIEAQEARKSSNLRAVLTGSVLPRK